MYARNPNKVEAVPKDKCKMTSFLYISIFSSGLDAKEINSVNIFFFYNWIHNILHITSKHLSAVRYLNAASRGLSFFWGNSIKSVLLTLCSIDSSRVQ